MKYHLDEMISLKINGQPGKAKVFGYEYDGVTWIYHLEIPDYQQDIKVLEGNLALGIDILTNGNTVKVTMDNEKAKS